MSRTASRSRRSRIPLASSQHSPGKAADKTETAWSALRRSGGGSRVSTEYVSKAACPASAGRSSTSAVRQAGWASCTGSRAATATLVSHAHLSPLEIITKPADVVVGQRGAVNLAQYRQPVTGVDRPSVSSHGLDPQPRSVWNQFQFSIGRDPEGDAQSLRDHHSTDPVYRNQHRDKITISLGNWDLIARAARRQRCRNQWRNGRGLTTGRRRLGDNRCHGRRGQRIGDGSWPHRAETDSR